MQATAQDQPEPPLPTVTATGGKEVYRPASTDPAVVGADGMNLPTRIKQATVQIENIANRHRSTGVCIHSNGWVLALRSELAVQGKDRFYRVAVNPGTQQQRVFLARLIGEDPRANLALLLVERPAESPGMVWLEVAPDTPLEPDAQIYTAGYPFAHTLMQGVAGEPGAGRYTPVTLAAQKILTVEREKDRVTGYTFSGGVEAGAYGGPVTDSSGRLCSILVGQTPDRRTEGRGIAIEPVRHFLAHPIIELAEGDAAVDATVASTVLRINIIQPLGEESSYRAKLILHPDDAIRREMVMHAEATGLFARIPTAAIGPGPESRRIQVKFANAQIEGISTGKTFKLDGRTMQLSAVAQIRFCSPPEVQLANGTMATGVVQGLEHLDLPGPDGPQKINTEGAESLTVTKLPPRVLPYLIEVTDNRGVVTRLAGTWDPDQGLAIPPAPSLPGAEVGPPVPPPSVEEVFTQELPGKFEQVAVGGSGRFLIFALPASRSVVIFDINTCRLVHSISCHSANILVTATRNDLIIVEPQRQIMKCYRLSDFQLERSIGLPFPAPVQKIAAGSGGHGPVAVWLASQDAPAALIMPPGLMPVAVLPGSCGWSDGQNMGQNSFSVSGNGQQFLYRTQDMRYGMADIFDRQFRPMTVNSDHGAIYFRLSYSGDMIYSLADYAKDTKQRRVELYKGKERIAVPAEDGSFYLAVGKILGGPQKNQIKGFIGDICLEGTAQSLCEVEAPELCVLWDLTTSSPYKFPDVNAQWRVRLVTQADAVITLPKSDDRVIVRRIHLAAALNAQDQKYLILHAPTENVATRGKRFTYQLRTLTNETTLAFKVESGPPGMFISRSGLLEWAVPLNLQDKKVTPLISVTGASGAIKYQTLGLWLTDPDGQTEH